MIANRRHLLAGLGAIGLSAPAIVRAQSGPLLATDFGVMPEMADDQTQKLQEALLAAGDSGRPLMLPAGTIFAAGLEFPGIVIEGAAGRTLLTGWQGGHVGKAFNASGLVIRNVGFQHGESETLDQPALLLIDSCETVRLERCSFRGGPNSGLGIGSSSVTVTDCDFTGHGDAAIHSLDSLGLVITGNRISDCGNAGIRIWRSESGSDGSIVTGNRIEKIDWRGGGNGQNGNGINIFRADEVIIADNRIADCAFSAVRLNTTNNTSVTGNVCLRSGEVAIFSEFAFTGSVIANNIVDVAATGISITNLDSGGQLAVCSGNIVRNITPASAVNPDTNPVGIVAEAETAITGNTVQNVPGGVGIAAGFGPFLRNVLIADNVISGASLGIGVSVVEDAGAVHIADNIISGPFDYAAVGLRWTDIAETDLFANAGLYPNVTVADNVVRAEAPGA